MQAGPAVPPQPPQYPGYPPGQPPPPGDVGFPPPSGYPLYPPPPAKKDNTAAVVIVVVLVLVAAILVPILYVMVTGLATSPAPSRPTISLSAGQWSAGTIVIVITSVSTGTLAAASLTYQVVAPNATVYFSGAEGPGPAVNGVAVTVTYHDIGGEGWVGPDDNIGVSVATASEVSQLHGTTFRIFLGTDVLGTAFLP